MTFRIVHWSCANRPRFAFRRSWSRTGVAYSVSEFGTPFRKPIVHRQRRRFSTTRAVRIPSVVVPAHFDIEAGFEGVGAGDERQRRPFVRSDAAIRTPRLEIAGEPHV